jgi:hypothetical protein
MHLHTRFSTPACIHAYMDEYIYVNTHPYIRMLTFTCLETIAIYMYAGLHTCIGEYISACIRACLCLYSLRAYRTCITRIQVYVSKRIQSSVRSLTTRLVHQLSNSMCNRTSMELNRCLDAQIHWFRWCTQICINS